MRSEEGSGRPTGAEALTARAVDALQARIDAFREAVATAEQEVSDEIVRGVGAGSFKGEQALIELGPFAVGRIDPERFAQLLGVADEPLTVEAIDVLGRAERVLGEFVATPRGHQVSVEPGGDLRDVVKQALARFGRAYGAARAVEMARAGTFDESEHGHLLGPLPFRLWNRAERQLAPPLVVRVRGDDCLPAGLGEFLDGNLVLLLVAEGPTTPAPLSRLITPGTFVLQTADPEELGLLARTEHPAVALLFDEERPGQAWFVHDPDAGDTSWARLSVSQLPSEPDVGRGRRPPAWLEELEHLRMLATAPLAPARGGGSPETSRSSGADGVSSPGVQEATEAADGGSAEPDPADRLAAWLLSRIPEDGERPDAAAEEG
ncbi:MAG: hypothetical protein R3304_05900 [Longimicrobiales bacterium]|nr:hypothetical protein [Longimicrobiales bacterium]